MICKSCKYEIDDDSIFCPYCGTEIKRCPECNAPLHPNARFCSRCGHQVSHEEFHDFNHENIYDPLNKETNIGVGGYYQPLNHDDVFDINTSEYQDFNEIKTPKKVNIVLIV